MKKVIRLDEKKLRKLIREMADDMGQQTQGSNMRIENLQSVIQSNNSVATRLAALQDALLEEVEEKLRDAGLCERITYVEKVRWDAKPGDVLKYEYLYINDADTIDAVYHDRGDEVIIPLSDLLQHASQGKVKIV